MDYRQTIDTAQPTLASSLQVRLLFTVQYILTGAWNTMHLFIHSFIHRAKQGIEKRDYVGRDWEVSILQNIMS